ncbi:hypothetical protein O0880_27525 [Janthinobacterium sp. SUN118]|uniref:hypothetical protein n=1 Tax=Janthinobacterium sp. SUN118 TaxID=3004100 RepID=UPI0025AEE987|nr:hypothetical protein [Janthinobacterium sp. SUN118]MDN2713174.1 hypothetical protein [Janthinobacterium sp. SUN118]
MNEVQMERTMFQQVWSMLQINAAGANAALTRHQSPAGVTLPPAVSRSHLSTMLPVLPERPEFLLLVLEVI